jgi:hypothetical protein
MRFYPLRGADETRSERKTGIRMPGFRPRQRSPLWAEGGRADVGGAGGPAPWRRGHPRWTRHGRGGRGIGPGNPGMPATASGGSPGSWGSGAASRPRATPHPTTDGRPPADVPHGFRRFRWGDGPTRGAQGGVPLARRNRTACRDPAPPFGVRPSGVRQLPMVLSGRAARRARRTGVGIRSPNRFLNPLSARPLSLRSPAQSTWSRRGGRRVPPFLKENSHESTRRFRLIRRCVRCNRSSPRRGRTGRCRRRMLPHARDLGADTLALVAHSVSAIGTVVGGLRAGKTPSVAVGLLPPRPADNFEGAVRDIPMGDDGRPTDRFGRVDGTRARSRDRQVAGERKR